MNLSKKILRVIIAVIGIMSITLIVLGIKLFLIMHTEKIPYRDITDGYNYIYADIRFKSEIYTVVVEGGMLYGNLKHYMYNDNYSKLRYMFMIDHSIRYNKPIEVNDSLNWILQTMKVDKSLITKYNDLKFIKENFLDKDDFLKRDLSQTDDINTIIYVLLKNNITCSRECESGCTYISWNYRKNK